MVNFSNIQCSIEIPVITFIADGITWTAKANDLRSFKYLIDTVVQDEPRPSGRPCSVSDDIASAMTADRIAGMTYDSIGAKYGIPCGSAYNTIARHARRNGIHHPLLDKQRNIKPYTHKPANRQFDKDAILADFDSGMDLSDIIAKHNVCKTTVSRVVGGIKERRKMVKG